VPFSSNKLIHAIKEITIADNTQGKPNTNNLVDLILRLSLMCGMILHDTYSKVKLL